MKELGKKELMKVEGGLGPVGFFMLMGEVVALALVAELIADGVDQCSNDFWKAFHARRNKK
ncbi:class IIb bacteriocin, lactobin A/cerein 7B family [Prolixibacteraceae bacterium JC049]|nr:class IIb bacteriocin, lactobin A/cerein 7B family [Prolixibacteraceae bacterium JC049]